MIAYITKIAHHKNNYLLNWENPDTGALMGQWFSTLKQLNEYIASWNCEKVNLTFDECKNLCKTYYEKYTEGR